MSGGVIGGYKTHMNSQNPRYNQYNYTSGFLPVPPNHSNYLKWSKFSDPMYGGSNELFDKNQNFPLFLNIKLHLKMPVNFNFLNILSFLGKSVPPLSERGLYTFCFDFNSGFIHRSQTSIKCATARPSVIDSEGPSSIIKDPNIRSFVAKSVLARFTRFLGVRTQPLTLKAQTKHCQIGQLHY